MTLICFCVLVLGLILIPAYVFKKGLKLENVIVGLVVLALFVAIVLLIGLFTFPFGT